MATGYTRNDTSNNISDGSIINAADLDGEFDAIQAAMDATDGHSHDGTVGGGAPILSVGPAQDVVVSASVVRPKTDNTVDLGTAAAEFKNLYLDGTAQIDTLQVDESATITANLTVNGNTTLGNAATDTVTVTADVASSLIPATDNTHDLGTATDEWRNLYIDGTANIDNLLADTATISGGTATLSSATVISATGGTTTLQRDDTSVLAGEILGKIDFQAPNVAGGGDAIVVAASVKAVAESTFDATTNDAALVFHTATSGTALERMRVDSTGNVGIGTDNPAYDLDISSSDTVEVAARIRNTNTGGTDPDANLYLDAGNANGEAVVEFQKGGASYGRLSAFGSDMRLTSDTGEVQFSSSAGGVGMRLTSAGKVGIGEDNPQQLLHLSGTVPDIQYTDTTGNEWRVGNNNGVFRFYDVTAAAERMKINAAGLVGIGATIPAEELHIQAAVPTLRLQDSDDSSYTNIIFNAGNIRIDVDPTAVGTSNSFFAVDIEDNEYMRVTSAGYVGVGTTSPTVKLDISNGATAGTALKVATTGAGNNIDMVDATGTARVRNVNGEMRLYGDVNTGGNGNIIFHPQGTTEAMRVDSSGRVLVGTTSDTTVSGVSSALQIRGVTAATSWASLTRTSSDANGPALSFGKVRGSSIVASGDTLGSTIFAGYDGTTHISAATIAAAVDGTPGTNDMPGRLVFSTTADGAASPTERMRIDSSGNVGIGTISPGVALDVVGTGSVAIEVTGTTSAVLRAVSDTTGTAHLALGDTDDVFRGGLVYDNTTDDLAVYTNNAEAMRITSTGNVGIGATDPATKLHVVGDSLLEDIDAGASSGPTFYLRRTSVSPADNDYLGEIRFQGTNSVGDNAVNYARIIAQATDVTDGTEDGSLTFWTTWNGASGIKMELANNGDLFLNEGVTVAGGFTLNGAGYLGQYRNSASATNGAFDIYSNWGATNRNVFRVQGNGNVLNYNNSYGALSDAKLKENIADATPKLEDICKLRVVNFNYIGDENKQIGLIAQEVEQVFPKLVDDTPDTDADGNETGEVTKSVKYSILVPMLVKALQEQQEMISALEARVTALGG